MYELPLDAKINCTDGHAGTSVAVTLNQENRIISHLIVEDGSGQQRLVPVSRIEKTSHDEIWLNCTEDELRKMPLFLVTEFVERAPQQSGDWEEEDGEWEDGLDLSSFEQSDGSRGMPMAVERVPDGEVAFHRNTEVEATDGYVGKVDKFTIAPDSGQITHFILQKGHFWGRKELVVPLSAVDSVDYNSLYLNVDKEAVKGFPELSK
ncbi:MAG: PRC-barrel domain-containing protein [Candidatus Promineifilaceae bacterium]|nr:PRC-barrel domain-containing protein [Candidatus Promineifilaceae bacterium]